MSATAPRLLSHADVSQQSELLRRRTMQFAVDVCRLIRALPRDEPGSTVQRQLTSRGNVCCVQLPRNLQGKVTCRVHRQARYRVEEADEAHGWLEFIQDSALLRSAELDRLIAEADEITAIMSASYGTAREKQRVPKI